jgi:lysophospholipase L1-like esterase
MSDPIWHRWRPAAAAVLFGALGLTNVLLHAADQVKDPSENTATKPVPKDVERHKWFVQLARKGGIEILFLGDSITDGWRNGPAFEIWKERFGPKAANFGIGGDRTEHVLWRITNGELEGIHPKVVALMIGTNNLGGKGNSPEQIAQGIGAIVKEVRARLPETRILLLGIFPRAKSSGDPLRDSIKEVNRRITKLDDGDHVRYLDIGPKFLEQDGDLSEQIMPDYVHLTARGYCIWADAIQPLLQEML